MQQALQKQVAQLAFENDMLKGIVRQRMGGSKSVSSVHNAPLGAAEVLNDRSPMSLIEWEWCPTRLQLCIKLLFITHVLIAY